MFADDDDIGGDESSMSDLERNRHNPHHNPWIEDPDEGDISNLHFTQTAPGRFNVQATITRSVSPQQFRAAGGMAPASIGGFMSMLTGIARAGAQQQMAQQARSQSPGQSQSESQETRGEGAEGQPRVHASRFVYHGGARLHPRDTNNPEPRIEPVDDITK